MQRIAHVSLRNLTRHAHTKAPGKDGPRIFLSKDETCFVSYHPTSDHPYGYTRPMPKVEIKDNSYLKVDAKNMITKSPNLEQIQNLTFTHKSYWREDRGKAKREAYKSYFDQKDNRKGLTS